MRKTLAIFAPRQERAGAFRGQYHVLGGTLSALDGVRPEDLNIAGLIERAKEDEVKEVILAMNATVDGQTTAHYITDHLETAGVTISRLAHGVPVGGELDYLDDGTITAAMKSRRPFYRAHLWCTLLGLGRHRYPRTLLARIRYYGTAECS